MSFSSSDQRRRRPVSPTSSVRFGTAHITLHKDSSQHRASLGKAAFSGLQRTDTLRWLQSAKEGDLLVTGIPGAGKTGLTKMNTPSFCLAMARWLRCCVRASPQAREIRRAIAPSRARKLRSGNLSFHPLWYPIVPCIFDNHFASARPIASCGGWSPFPMRSFFIGRCTKLRQGGA